MKLVAACAVVLAVAAAPAVAEPTTGSTLVGMGVTGGRVVGTSGDMTLGTVGGAIGVDRGLTPHLWARAQLGFGLPSWRGEGLAFTDATTNDQGLVLQARAGVTARACEGHWCLFAGADVGAQHVTYEGNRMVRYAPNPDTGGGGEVVQHVLAVERTDALLVPHAGIEIGGSLKFRPSIELPTTRDGTAIHVQLALVAEL